MQYFGGKLSAAQLQVAGWVGSVRRSLQGALELVWGTPEEKQEEDKEEEEEEEGGYGGGRFLRAMAPLRSFASHSRRSLRRFSIRSRPNMQRRANETCSVRANTVTQYIPGMHDIIGTLSASDDIGFKINCLISTSTLISADIITPPKKLGYCFLRLAVGLKVRLIWHHVSHVPCGQKSCLCLVKQTKFLTCFFFKSNCHK